MLLSEGYRAEQARLHSFGNYGTASLGYGPMVSQMVEKSGAKTLLDYGCGSMRNLAKVLDCDVVYEGYDPAVPAFAADPDAAWMPLVECVLMSDWRADDWATATLPLTHVAARSGFHRPTPSPSRYP
jgi:hypothetical protein